MSAPTQAGARGPVATAVVSGSTPDWLLDAIQRGGGELAPLAEAEALVWFGERDAQRLRRDVAGAPHARWVHLLIAGVDDLVAAFDSEHLWTCGKGLSAAPLAEHALMLALAGLRGLPEYARSSHWGKAGGRTLTGARVTIVGGGAIAEQLLRHLAVFGCETTVVRRRAEPMPLAARVLTVDRLHEALRGAQVVFLALALTPQSERIIGAAELEAMGESCLLVNVARGAHVDTDALVAALSAGTIAGAALDVTDPEPLPSTHPLWKLPNCVITPHTATTLRMIRPAVAARVEQNVARFAAGLPLMGLIDVAAGY
jgi:phosphoglycerate dehydrogenase-like enzyme